MMPCDVPVPTTSVSSTTDGEGGATTTDLREMFTTVLSTTVDPLQAHRKMCARLDLLRVINTSLG
jgi:hypothetical protein